jgi:Cu2+-exporting ATPase
MPVLTSIAIARRARQLGRQNLLFAAACIAVAAPAALMGLLSPLAAALAISGAALLVYLNARRARLGDLYARNSAVPVINQDEAM